MLKIEYELTLEDEIDRLEVDRDYVAQLPLLYWQNGYIIPIILLIGNTPYIWTCLTTDVGFYTGFEGVSVSSTFLNLLLSISLIPQVQAKLSWRNSIAKRRIRKSWRNNPGQIKLRKLIISNTEFTISKIESNPALAKEAETLSYSWDKLRRYFESDRGFNLDFSGGYQFFVPKRIFANQARINEFRELLSNSKR